MYLLLSHGDIIAYFVRFVNSIPRKIQKRGIRPIYTCRRRCPILHNNTFFDKNRSLGFADVKHLLLFALSEAHLCLSLYFTYLRFGRRARFKVGYLGYLPQLVCGIDDIRRKERFAETAVQLRIRYIHINAAAYYGQATDVLLSEALVVLSSA